MKIFFNLFFNNMIKTTINDLFLFTHSAKMIKDKQQKQYFLYSNLHFWLSQQP